MARIELHGIAHSYASSPASEDEYALKPIDIVWEDGGAYALLGPSGCGKTTLLNIISGLIRPTAGSVIVHGKDVTIAPPQARNIAQVFQFPVLYDTMTVAENLAFPLRNRGMSKREASDRVEQIAALLELTGDLGRRASGLSAEMKQRVSLGRGLVRKDVAAILLDEPLTVIDPHAKWLLRRKLMQVHAELKTTLIYVTHDQVEAMTLADEVIVMSEGSVVQRGTPQELFERPAHEFVGHFIGSPGMNLLPCSIEGFSAVIEGRKIPLPAEFCKKASVAGGGLVLGIRPEFLRLTMTKSAEDTSVDAIVTRVEDLGRGKIVSARLGEETVRAKVSEEVAVRPGEACYLDFQPQWITLYSGGRAIT
ncbi:MAG: ABC transporter ATP-binding protein [Polyangiaceae bacterium]|nr:ABC transporter ATP-binding protein [Polyangiaceae bacterium]